MHIIPPPVLPADAPFNDAQRHWLKGFFDGLSAIAPGSGAPAETSSASSGPSVAILWGSQTGSSEGLAKRLAKELEKNGALTRVIDMASAELASLKPSEPVAIITSTYGDGEPPDNAAELYASVMSAEAPSLKDIPFAVLALGDSSYPDYCKCGKDFDRRFEELGGQRMFQRLDCDVDFDNEFKSFTAQLVSAIKEFAV